MTLKSKWYVIPYSETHVPLLQSKNDLRCLDWEGRGEGRDHAVVTMFDSQVFWLALNLCCWFLSLFLNQPKLKSIQSGSQGPQVCLS